jgi:hypothetical protein
MQALILGLLILVAVAAFEYAGEGSRACWRAREARQELRRARMEAKREVVRARLEFAQERRDFLREKARLRREAIREFEREFRRSWDDNRAAMR